MYRSETNKNTTAFGRNYLYLSFFSIGALIVTFSVSIAGINFYAKQIIFAVIFFLYILLCAGIYLRQRKQLFITTNDEDFDSLFNTDVEAKLVALEEARLFYGTTLKPADMFRLLASRVNDITPYTACALYMADETGLKLKITNVGGDEHKKYVGAEINWQTNFTGETFKSCKPQIVERRVVEKNIELEDAFDIFHTAMAVPLVINGKTFGVFALFGEPDIVFNRKSLLLFEAVGTRIAPLIVSSMAFENTLTNALTDTLTSLPNERAFYLVLENQIAEAQRFRDERPLTILAIDINGFSELNQRLGHTTGDRLLLFAAVKIKNQLRQMDLLTRSASDEFFAVLPTASEEITREIIDRIERIFVSNPFESIGQEQIHLRLHFGAASFGKDGETAEQLIQHALLRKKQAKKESKDNKILWFSKDYVN